MKMKSIVLALALAICFNPSVFGHKKNSEIVRPGIEVLENRNFQCLEGKRVGLVTNPSGVDSRLRSTIDILFAAKNVHLVALFGPEHGVRGDAYAGDSVSDTRDQQTGLPVYSIYGAHREPSAEMLKGIDVMVYDIGPGDEGLRQIGHRSGRSGQAEPVGRQQG